MTSPTVSVVIATYNRRERISRTLDSVIAQTMTPREVIVIDDGSTNDTAAWIRGTYPQVIVCTFPNGGSAMARNRGAAQATGDVLVFLDHDDALLPAGIETLMALLVDNPEARAAFADHEIVNVVENDNYPNHHDAIPSFARLRTVRTLRTAGHARIYGQEMYRALLHGNLLQQPWAIYREDFRALGGYDPDIRFCEDWELYLRVTKSVRIAMTDAVISTHFIEGQNLHRAAGQRAQQMKVLEKHIQLNRSRDLKASRVLRRRLAMYYKSIGDKRHATHAPGAWHAYVQSLRNWPFDPVVAARCLAWTVPGIFETGGTFDDD